MKKFLVGIVTLVAAVMLSSPAFGALTYFPVDDVGTFSFDYGTEVEENKQMPHPPGEGDVISEMVGWGWPSMTDLGEIRFYQEFDPPDNDGYVNFDAPVQIIVAKWGGNPGENVTSWAFLLDGYTTHFDWADLPYGMSHVRGYNAVPIPAAVWLLGSGVLGLVAVRRRRS